MNEPAATPDFDLIAVRHGRTAWNADGRFQGHTDVALDDVGRAQARHLAAVLATRPFSRALTSDLSRARETATIVLEGRDIPLEDDSGWREMRFGEWEGLRWAEIAERYPQDAANLAASFPQPTGGESFDEVTRRVEDALARLRSNVTAGDVVLVATHAGPLHALLRVALGESEAKALAVRFSPATYTHMAFRDGRATLVELNAGAEAPSA